MIPVALSFGCPRSGTTFMQRALAELSAALTEKIGEGSMFHPCRSTRGLLDLAHLFAGRRVAFVRTVRHPVEIAASFVATRTFVEDDPTSFEGLAKNTDRDVVEFIRSESSGFAAQRHLIGSHDWPHALFEVRYEDLAGEGYRSNLADDVTAVLGLGRHERDALNAALDEFNTEPARPGRLSRGKDPVTQKQRRMFAHWLRKTIRREGYE